MRPVLLALSLCTTLIGHAQLLLNGTLTAEQLVQNTLLGTGVTVSNVTFNNLPGNLTNPQVGYFDGSATVLAMNSGLVLCTGGITVAPGPNNSGSLQVEVLDNFVADDDLDNVAAAMCMDIASLEFDFVPTGDSISLSCFCSEEYLGNAVGVNEEPLGSHRPGIFLNPESTTARVGTPANHAGYEVFDALGQRMPIATHDGMIDVRTWMDGIYFLKLTSDEVRVIRFAVQH